MFYVGPLQGACWEYVGPMLRHVGPSWANVGLILGLCWAYLGPMLGHVEPRLGNLADFTTF